ncbi:TetR/AcrR family transcriptional regulator [Aurantiacibacter poecillastricola]|uniref:TetR/AcrR family transcriptional regulator n=1 Tax=Aurantiacibacter poecillastricola TaxID=3064385 RepID=UPI00273D49BF|nr:TetR/AcrR family transcriptional regulator [Aurantiacibacter sp. 219JJ12-13]MDP5262423.1 TetR/AcrR family transcriptional regulator [Aurantiacibacter sp. 219JJ12-13]
MATTRPSPADTESKAPRTARGRETLRRLLDAAAKEFGEKGFHEASISGITRRAGTALGSFYTYFDSKDEIFRALVKDMSGQVAAQAGRAVTPDLAPFEVERAALHAFLEFARDNKEIYRIIDEAEFVDPASFREHYETTAKRILQRLKQGEAAGKFREGMDEAHAWALMGMNVFLGLRYSVWDEGAESDRIADLANDMLRRGIGRD